MNIGFWEQLAFSILMSVLQQLHVDPTRIPLLKNILVPIAQSIMVLYPDVFAPK